MVLSGRSMSLLDGKRMATAGDDGLVKIWNLEDEEATERVEILEIRQWVAGPLCPL